MMETVCCCLDPRSGRRRARFSPLLFALAPLVGVALALSAAEPAQAQSSDSTLRALAVEASTDGVNFSPAGIWPEFSAGHGSYDTVVSTSHTHVRVTPTANHGGATLQVGKGGSLTPVASGAASAAVALVDGANQIRVRVTAENGGGQTYRVTVTRGGRVIPAPPRNVQAVAGNGKLTLTWAAPVHWGSFPARGYEVDWYAGASPPAAASDWNRATPTPSPLAATATSYDFTGTYGDHTVANGTTYQLQIRTISTDPGDNTDHLVSVWVVRAGTPTPTAAPGADDDGGVLGGDDDDDNGGVGDADDEPSSCTLMAPYWSGPTGGFAVRPESGRTSVSVTCGARTTEYAAEDGLVTRLVRGSCPGGLRLEGAAPGGWYWQHGERNAAAAPFVCSEALGGPRAVAPGGVMSDATDDATLLKHDTARLIGIVPHLAGNKCSEYVTPYWQGDGGVVVRPAEGRSTAKVRVQCGGTWSTLTASAGADGVAAELVRKDYCTDEEGDPTQGRLTVTGAAPGGWYWVDGERNAAVAPLMCANLLGGPAAVDPGGVFSRATEDGTHFRHDTERLIGVVPHVVPDRDE